MERVPTSEAARRLGVHTDAIRRRISRGELRATKEGSRWLVELEDPVETDAEGSRGAADEVQILVRGPVFMGRGFPALQSVVEEIIDGAQDEIHIAAYFLTSSATDLLSLLEKALEGGVRVTAIINSLEQQPQEIRRKLQGMEDRFIHMKLATIFRPSGGQLHAGVLVVDRKTAVVGSPNFTWDRGVTNHEVALLISGNTAWHLASLLDTLALVGGEWVGSAPPPPKSAVKTASGEPERLKLFEEWLAYERSKRGFVIFVADKELIVQFHFALGPGVVAEVDTSSWEERLREPLPKSVTERLVERGFRPPDRDHEYNYWQQIDEPDPRTLASLAEWLFRDIIDEDENFTAEVAACD